MTTAPRFDACIAVGLRYARFRCGMWQPKSAWAGSYSSHPNGCNCLRNRLRTPSSGNSLSPRPRPNCSVHKVHRPDLVRPLGRFQALSPPPGSALSLAPPHFAALPPGKCGKSVCDCPSIPRVSAARLTSGSPSADDARPTCAAPRAAPGRFGGEARSSNCFAPARKYKTAMPSSEATGRIAAATPTR